jgi:peptidoglycan/xylan/chitin deacetylase (PgdA/CDA1 family)
MTMHTDAGVQIISATTIGAVAEQDRTGSAWRLGKRDVLAACVGNPVCAAAIKRAFRTPSLLCVNYHRVAYRVDHDDDTIAATPSQLEWQAQWLAENMRMVGGREIVGLLQGGFTLREPSVCLTFDDGYADNFEVGRMLMEKFRISALFFIPTGFIETGVVPSWDRMAYSLKHTTTPAFDLPPIGPFPMTRIDGADRALAGSQLMEMFYTLPPDLRPRLVELVEAATGVSAGRPQSPLFMSWDQIRELHAMGHTIGAHTVNHPVMSTLSADDQRLELQRSRRTIEKHLGVPVELFAYPFGKRQRTFSDVTQKLVKEAGFLGAFANEGGWNRPGRLDPFNLRRIRVDLATTRARFRARVLSRGVIPV